MKTIVKKQVLGVGVSDTTQKGVLKYIEESVLQKADPYYIVTPNPEIIMRAQADAEFREILNKAALSLCDGVGILLASKILGNGLKERITGVDLMEALCKEMVRKPVSIGFLGGRGRVAEKTAKCLERKYGKLNIVFTDEEWSEAGFVKARENNDLRFKIKEERDEFINPKSIIVNPMIDILFVAFGAPKQEKWMAESLEKGGYRVAIGVGGAFDYFGGTTNRSPIVIRSLGLEWLYRLIRQPWRWRRQLALLRFLKLVLLARMPRKE